jgi:hypothetical protein
MEQWHGEKARVLASLDAWVIQETYSQTRRATRAA